MVTNSYGWKSRTEIWYNPWSPDHFLGPNWLNEKRTIEVPVSSHPARVEVEDYLGTLQVHVQAGDTEMAGHGSMQLIQKQSAVASVRPGSRTLSVTPSTKYRPIPVVGGRSMALSLDGKVFLEVRRRRFLSVGFYDTDGVEVARASMFSLWVELNPEVDETAAAAVLYCTASGLLVNIVLWAWILRVLPRGV